MNRETWNEKEIDLTLHNVYTFVRIDVQGLWQEFRNSNRNSNLVRSLVIKNSWYRNTNIYQWLHLLFLQITSPNRNFPEKWLKSLRSNVKTRSRSVLLSLFLDQHYQDHTSRVKPQSCVQDSTPGLRGVRTRFRHCVQLNLPWSDAHEIKFTWASSYNGTLPGQVSKPGNIYRHLVVNWDLVKLGGWGRRLCHGARHALFVAELLARYLVCDDHTSVVFPSVCVTSKGDNVLKHSEC